MGTDIAAQLSGLGKSLLLGVGFALLYDALRSLRLRRRRQLTAWLDALYCAVLILTVAAFTLRVGGGELRLYMVFAVLAGAAMSFHFLSPLLRSLWAFWAEVLAQMWRLLRLPWRVGKNFYGKLHKLTKRVFLFWQNLFIIKNYRRFAQRARRRAEAKEGSYAAKSQTRQRRIRRRAAGGSARVGGDALGQSARRDQRRRGAEERSG